MLWSLLVACIGSSPVEPPSAEVVAPTATEQPASVKTSVVTHGLLGVDYACAPCESLMGSKVASAKASSTLEGNTQRYGAQNALDGDPSSAWCEGASGPGVGATFTIQLAKPMILHGGSFLGGYFKSDQTLSKNARPRKVAVRTAIGEHLVEFADPTVAIANAVTGEAIPVADWLDVARNNPAMFVGSFPEQAVTEVQLEVLEVWSGSAYEDLCFSRIEFFVVDPEAL